ncbi:MAG: kelch repeat-containing protein [Steroidobacteraceae bacterium]
MPAASNNPGARYGSSSWTDGAGKLWLFGGTDFGYFAPFIELRFFNDLWRYDPVTGQWTWLKGSSSRDQSGIYGTQGAPAANTTPGARYGSGSWMDSAGKLWLFGGLGCGLFVMSACTPNDAVNDLWKYDPVSGQWAWMSGSSTTNADSVYGTQGIPSAANRPGARSGSATWIDGAGKLWLFGGNGHSSSGSRVLNDLWKYDPGSGQWTWISGSSTPNALGVYGSQGMPSGTALPGARSSSVSWTDGAGKQWVFGGNGYSSSGSTGYLNDLWHWQQ